MQKTFGTSSTSTAAGPATRTRPPGRRPLGRRAIAKAEKRARILAAARRLMSEKGYAQMSMSEVASHADVAAGTVFQYAATKAELLMMVTADIWADHVARTIAAPPTAGPRPAVAVVDEIVELLSPFFEMSLHWPETTAWIAREILFGDELPHRLEVLALVESLEVHIARVLGGCLEAPSESAGARLEVGARMIVTSCLAELNRARQGRADKDTLTRRIGDAVSLVADGVGAR